MNWKTLHSKKLLHDRWINLRADSCEMPDGTIIEPFYVLDYPDWINAVAVTQDNQVVLTRLYRHGIGATVLELPSGTVDAEDASHAEAMRRELLEETGYAFEHIELTAVTTANPSNQSNKVYCFLATGGRKVAEQQLDESEEIEVEPYDLADFEQLLYQNKLIQAVHITSAFFALQRLKK